jgi:hypothetical protein
MNRVRALAALLPFLAACAHEKPFGQDAFDQDTTLMRGQDRQLTFNPGTDRTPAWRPDGSGILYMFEAISASPRDRCLGELPATGGTMRNVACPVTTASLDSLDTFFEPSAGPQSKLLYLREASPPDGITAFNSALMLADGPDLLAATAVQPYPYTASNGKIHQGISNIHWLSNTRAVYLAEKVLYLSACGSCPTDTVRTGIEVVQLDFAGPSPTTSIVPNTDDVSSIDATAEPDTIIITRNGDARVYQLSVSTGATTIIHDFGPGEIARDAQVRGNRLYAVIKGRVSFVVDPVLGPVQRDEGGQLIAVDLSNGISSPMIVTERFFRRPAISPEGHHLVAEAFQTTITSCGSICRDTTISKVADLWLFDLP